MKTLFGRARSLHLVLFVAGVSLLQNALGQDFNVSTPNDQFAYVINGVNSNPTITLMRGHTYTFAVSSSPDHPFFIGTSVFGPVAAGVSGNNTSSGTVTFAVPTNASDCVYYCSVHGFSGQIHMIDAPPPPVMTIVGITVTTNVQLTVQQATTNGFTFVPEANTNLPSTNWFALTVQSNSFANGTNEIWCGKPPGTNVFFRIHAQ